ncbi:MAG: S-methyl-5-thioribose-1-phosphate isomerase [Gemmatimonadetes bacterium]|nr:S-methyl-5-thioribose-1-phosphate isomerase [Gemmatimonadota bacterium]MCY3677726.1 S-methyl-5-thioribose-1-phosphate isomerase [Gemmatimonadota bacterium]MYA41733.1 S-methyl-5-thioribose-1-phosphate isomerase [Gemmatimonadota bacterium]MYF46703.1 S-methyl-5-thioribose-1-phosphate isomerase [Paracoccaceae bacterium]MYJ10366.1 S-methyl-5-thioribose-1-phosphate isomerase [Gemmatimonadota bacterium]
MNVGGVPYRAIFTERNGREVRVIDQTLLPHRFETIRLESTADAARAIRDMVVRGAPLIGATAAYGVALAMRGDPSDASLARATALLAGTRPTAVNLRWALEAAGALLRDTASGEREAAAYDFAARLCEDDVRRNRSIGEHGLGVFRAIARSGGSNARGGARELNVMTHCNAGWLATVDWGTATAPMYLAHDEGLRVHVWVRETRPRFQGAGLTSWELGQHGVPHTLVSDSAAGHLLSRGKVDVVIVGTDRTTAAGDVANKVGTYPLALAARDNGVPFYVAAPSPSIDWSIEDGASIPIEERDPEEITRVWGVDEEGVERRVRVVPEGTRAANYAFDVTPRRLVTGLVTERGVCAADREALGKMFGR